MTVIVRGAGPPLVLIPGIQGRCEWMAPAIEALSRRFSVLTFSLSDVRGPDLFERWTAHIDALLDRAGHSSAVIVGVSFGGLVAAHYAARRPARTTRLVLLSAPSPSWRLDPQSARYVRHPRLALPFFAVRAVRRLLPEVIAAIPTFTGRARFCAGYAMRGLRFPVSPRQMAAMVRDWERADLAAVVRSVTAPTLVITGEETLDRVVPVRSTLELLTLIPGARHAILPRTGHVGFLSRPGEFAALVSDFAESGHDARRLAAGRS